MEILKYLFLGVLQGLTEFLPVSSSGHLVLAQNWMGLDPPGVVVEVALHIATLLSVCIVYFRDIRDLVTQKNYAYFGRILLATVITVLIALPFRHRIEQIVNSNIAVQLTGAMLLFTAMLLLVAHFKLKKSSEAKQTVTTPMAVAMGIAQSVAVLPGVSRSGATICTAILLDADYAKAARFSFIMSIPIMLGAGILSIPDAVDAISSGHVNAGALAVAFSAAALSGIMAIRLLLLMLRKRRLDLFGAYCGIIGIAALAAGLVN